MVSVHPIDLTGARKVVELLHIREHIASRLLNSKSKTGIKTISAEINLTLIWVGEGNFFLGDFNICLNDNVMTPFYSLNDLTNLIDQPTCYKNPDKPTSIDLILTNYPNFFQQNSVFEKGLSEFHKMVVTELKMGFQKLEPQIVAYRD